MEASIHTVHLHFAGQQQQRLMCVKICRHHRCERERDREREREREIVGEQECLIFGRLDRAAKQHGSISHSHGDFTLLSLHLSQQDCLFTCLNPTDCISSQLQLRQTGACVLSSPHEWTHVNSIPTHARNWTLMICMQEAGSREVTHRYFKVVHQAQLTDNKADWACGADSPTATLPSSRPPPVPVARRGQALIRKHCL
ncbi:unnamed protein product [Protopolystoma xenopodis]|uniref:Uncharacterized protein n=1 Tax=Protopolystoma xenopodis TaxID=117903 RepID=A0A448WAH2_9PLAT|nr:unnamed protein product [Protopolystoma xenopodis]